MGGWENALILKEGEHLVESWIIVLSTGGQEIKIRQNKKVKEPRLVLTNRRLAYLGKTKMFGGEFEFLLDIPLESIIDLVARPSSKKWSNCVDIRTAETIFEAKIIMLDKGIKAAMKSGAKEGITFGLGKSKTPIPYFIQHVVFQLNNRKQELEAK